MMVSDADISHALLISTCNETYPESDEVLTTDLSQSTLRASLQLIEEAKKQTEIDIQSRSQDSLLGVDEWITQARRLQEDIERSKDVAREIVKEYEQGRNLSARIQDAKAKVEFLQKEISFNQAVTLSLEETWSVVKALDKVEATLAAGRLTELPSTLEQLSFRNGRLTDSTAKEMNGSRLLRIQDAVMESLTVAAHSMVEFERADGCQRVTVDHKNHTSLGVTLDYLLEAIQRLGSLDGLIQSQSRMFHRRICQPLLSRSSKSVTYSVDHVAHCLTLSSSDREKDTQDVLRCLSSVFVFLHTHFPQRLSSAIGTKLSKELLSTLIRDWLSPSIPLDLSELQQRYEIKTTVRELANLISSYRWPGHAELMVWLEGLPQTWLEKRHTSALDAVRKVLKSRRGPSKVVERVEHHTISGEDEALAQSHVGGWHAGRTDNELETTAASATIADKEEEDLSAWDFDEEIENASTAVMFPSEASEDVRHNSHAREPNEAYAGGTRPDGSGLPPESFDTADVNGSTEHREVTLTETYMVTDIPDHLLTIISRDVQDATRIKTSEYASSESISASVGLLSLPTPILALFRATASAYYTSLFLNGNMQLYNDCIYLLEKLRCLARAIALQPLLEDCNVLENFATSAYIKEMDVQMTILGDLLDGAQGFVNCTRFPNSAACENAVSSTIDRLRTVHQDWSLILSRSALLQSSGTLLSRVCDKILKDIEDMEDISEPESQRLATFCGRFTALEDLFMPEKPASVERVDAAAVPLTAVYVSNWLRFQYLSQILESSLVDIQYLWGEGELSLEFTADEVIELIEALFAESSHRRSAIAEIRRRRP